MRRFMLGGIVLLVAVSVRVSAQNTNALEVLVSSPRGETSAIDQTQTIFASFSHTMVPLRAAPVDEAQGPMLIEPGLKGKYRWMGTKTLVFIPSNALPYATAFSVRIPAGTKSLSGKALASDVRWRFETPRPRIVVHSPQKGQRYVELDHSISILMNQAVDPQSASTYITIEERGDTEISYPQYSARHASKEELKPMSNQITQGTDSLCTLLLIPTKPFKKGRTYVVRCKAGLRGVEGPLGMSDDYSFTFSTFNELAFKGVGLPDRFSPSLPLRLLFSNPVSVSEVATRLVFDPALQPTAEEYGYDYQSEELSISLPLEAETEYKAVLKAGVKDRFGNAITEDHPFRFRTGSFKPYVRLTTGPGVIEADEQHAVPVTFMNVDSVKLRVGKVSPERIVPLMRQLDFSSYAGYDEEGDFDKPDQKLVEGQDLGASRIWKVKGPANKQFVRPVELDAVLGESAEGIVLLQVDNLRPDPERRYYKSLLQVTSLAITAKFSPESNLIWVTRLKDASPMAAASVEIRNDSNAVVWSGKTNGDGLVETPGWGPLNLVPKNRWSLPRQWIVVRHENDVAFSSSEWQSGIEPWSFGIAEDWVPRYEPMQGTLFTDRGLYKAGEKVEIKGIVRTRSQGTWKIAKGSKVRLSITNSRNEEIFKNEFTLSAFGSLAASVELKPSVPLGYCAMSLETRDKRAGKEEWTGIASGSFRVEAFRPAEFEVTARSDRQSYIVGDTFFGYLSARYLFGGVLKRQPVSWRVSTSATDWNPAGWDGYFFGPLPWLSKYGQRGGFQLLANAQEEMDEQGSIRVQSDLKVGEIVGTVSLLFEGDVTSPARQQISGRTSVIAHGGEFYLGLSPSSTLVELGSRFGYKFVAITPEGKTLPEIPVALKVFRRVWRSVRKAESGGRYGWISEEHDSVVDSSAVQSGKEPIERSFQPKESGFYYIQAEARDKRGNALLTQCYFYVSGSGYVAWERSNDDRIELVADKKDFSPGETARILVKSPYEKAIALVTVEREGILKHYTRTLVGSAPQIDLPIRKEHVPNVYVSVVLLQGRKEKPPANGQGVSLKEGDVGRPSFKVGYVGLSVSPKEHQLAVHVATGRKEYHPGDSVEVTVQVRDAQGKSAVSEIALSVADRGVLNLIGYRLPDVFDQFYLERSLAVKTTETRMHLVEQRDYGEKGEDAGGGGMEEPMAPLDAEGMRRDFRYTAYWNASLLTDSQGNASVRFKLPDNLTTFQVMAVAQTVHSEFGRGDTSLVVNKPLLLQPSYPRFARVGDSFEGGVVIHNYGNADKMITLVTKARGAKLIGSDSSAHRVGPGKALEVRKRYRVESPGKATFISRAWTEEQSDGIQWTIPIHLPNRSESVALYESTMDSLTRETLTIPSSIYPDAGQVEFQVASTPLSELSAGISYLFTYPYGCLEQRLSAVLPLILAEDLVKAFKLEIYEGKDHRQVVVRMLDDLAGFQQPGGGFSYWRGEQQESPFVSAYAIYALTEAQKRGYAVDKRMLENGLEYLRRVLRGEERYAAYSDHAWRSTRALILYTLALMKKPDHGYMEKLYAERRELPLFGKAYLLRALQLSKGKKSMISALLNDLGNMAKVSPTSAHFEERDGLGLAWVFDSNVRTTALVLQVLVETQSSSPLIPRLVRWLLDQRKNGAWRTTQENLYVVEALATYFRELEKEEADFRAKVRFAGSDIITTVFKGRTLATVNSRVALSTVKQGSEERIELRKEGAGTLFYGVRMEYSPKGETKAKEEGLTVVKTVEPVEGPPDKQGAFAIGRLYKVTVSLATSQARNFIMVEDPLPAGFEAVNSSLQTTAVNLEQLVQQSDDSRGWTFNPFSHQEAYDDHVLLFAEFLPAGVYSYSYLVRTTSFGTFTVPGTHAEAMYEPEVFGQTPSSVCVVK